MHTLNAAQQTAFNKQGAQPVWLVDITTGGTTYRYTSTDNHRIVNVSGAIISSVSPISSSVDPFTRRFQRGAYMIDFLDDVQLRALLASVYIKNLEVRIYFGEAALSEGDYITVARALGTDAHVDGASIKLEATDLVYSILSDSTLTFPLFNQHPLEVLERVFQKAGVPTAYYNAASLDHTTYTDISHFNCSRFPTGYYYLANPYWAPAFYDPGTGNNNYKEPKEWAQINSSIREETGAQIMDDVANLCGGTMQPDQDGVWFFSQYDYSASSVATITEDDLMDFRQMSATEDLASKIKWVLGGSSEDNETIGFEIKDTAAETALNGFTGAGGDVNVTVDLKSKWCNAIGALWPDTLKTPPTASTYGVVDAFFEQVSGVLSGTYKHFLYNEPNFMVGGTGMTGFAGNHFQGNATTRQQYTVDASEALSSSRLAYLLIVHDGSNALGTYDDPTSILQVNSDAQSEIVACDASDIHWTGANTASERRVIDFNDGGLTWMPRPSQLVRYTLATGEANGGRSQFTATNQAPQAWLVGSLVFDVTIPVAVAQRHITRRAEGCARLAATLPLKYISLQPGDVVNITHSQVVAKDVTAADSDVYWEVLRTELRPNGIDVIFGYLRGATAYTPTYAFDPPDVPLSPYNPARVDGADDPITDTSLTIVTTAAQEILYRS